MKGFDFAQETMDYRLFWLKFAKRIWMVFVATILGALLVGVPYYLVNVTFGPGPSYKVVSEYYLEYGEDNSGAIYEYFNYYTWDEIADTDEFITILRNNLPEEMFASEETLRTYTNATVESDGRYLYTTVQTEHPDKTLIIARAMEQSMVDFGTIQKELQSVKVVTSPLEAEKTYPDVRTARAFILGAVLGLFVGLTGLSIYIVCDSSIDLPNVMEKRYGVKALGCKNFTESKNNIRYCVTKSNSVSLLCREKFQQTSIEQYFKDCLPQEIQINCIKEDILSETYDFEKLRNQDAIILLVEAGARNGKRVEREIEQLKRQDISLAGAFLYNEDEKLLKRYYR